MANIKGCMLSQSNDWETPADLFARLDGMFHFQLDPCADESNAKCERYFTKADDGLKQSWGGGCYFLQSTVWARTAEMGSQGV